MAAPEMIGKYKILSEIAKGGMGTVYLAVHPSLKRQVIIKKLMLKNGAGSIRERFKREAQILLDLSSPYVLRMFDYFSEGRADYIVLEFIDGMSLDKLIEKQISLPPVLALLVFQDACLGLKNAHSKNIVHRDIKPGNILISKRAEVKLADFGIASGEKESELQIKNSASDKTITFDATSSITQVGSTLGTPAYMSPEQLTDSSSVDNRADIYSMGVMLYEMVTGTKPYAGDMAPATIAKIKKGKYIPPEKIDRKIPRIVRVLVKKMMKPNPSKRYQSIDPVISKIRKYLKKFDTHAVRVNLAQAIISPKPLVFPDYVPKNHKKKAITISVIAACILLGLGLTAWNLGFIHKIFLRKWYTPVYLSITVPSSAFDDSDLPAKAYFFENDNNKLPEVKNSRRDFENKKKKNSKDEFVVFYTRPVYLKAGEYRVKVVEGPYVWWKSIVVGKDEIKLDLNFLKNAARPIKVHLSAFDSETSEDMSSLCKYMISANGKWKEISSVDFSKLTSGSVYKFLISAEGYYDEYFSLRLDWYQDELFINGKMRKKQ